MKNGGVFLFLAMTSLLMLSCSSVQPIDSHSEILFDDDSISWTTNGEAEWTIANGILSAENGLGYAITTTEYDNFILEADFFPTETMNSGIFIRCAEDNMSASSCYEVNIADNHENPDFRTGAIVTHGKPIEILQTINKWNRFRILAKNDRIGVWIDGIKTADIRDTKSKSGTIAMQVNGEGIIKFKNIALSKLK